MLVDRTQRCRAQLATSWKLIGFVFALPFLAPGAAVAKGRSDAQHDGPRNVLFISIDDLRPQLGCYGQEQMVTPHLDRLAREGRLFNRHYVQVPTCGASRYALLTGRYPTHRLAFGNGAFNLMPSEEPAGAVSLPHLFKKNGYHTVSIGKISHSPDGRRHGRSQGGRGDGRPEVPFSWSEVGAPAGKWNTSWRAFFAYADGGTRIIGKTPSYERADAPDDGYPDGLIAQAAIDKLRQLKDRRFFLAVGFYKPHLPFNAPAKYWDLYDRDKIALAPYRKPPQGVDPRVSLHKSGELTPRYSGLATPGKVTDDEARRLRHAYFACVSYIDAQVGKLLREIVRTLSHQTRRLILAHQLLAMAGLATPRLHQS